MTRRPITELSVDAAYRRLQADYHQRFEAAMNSGAPIVDNAGHLTVIGQLEYDGPRCEGEDCRTPVEDDVPFCDDCAEDLACPTCRGRGGWQQPDGLIVECPRGCMTSGDDYDPSLVNEAFEGWGPGR